MVLSTPEYLCFLTVIFVAFWALAKHRTLAIALIAAANLFFYYRWGWIYLAVIPVAASIDFWLAKSIPARRWLIWVSVVLNLGLLGSAKIPATGIWFKLSL